MNWLRKLLAAPIEAPCNRSFPGVEDETALYRARRSAVLAAIDAAIVTQTGIPADVLADVHPEKLRAFIALGMKLKG